MRFPGRIRRYGTGLLGECEIGISGSIGRLHVRVAGQGGGNAEFLLRPVDIRHAQPGGGLIKPRSHTAGPKMYREFDGWLRPVRDLNADRIVRLRPSRPTASHDNRSSASELRSSRNGATAGRRAPSAGTRRRPRSRRPLSSRGQGMPLAASQPPNRSALNVRPSKTPYRDRWRRSAGPGCPASSRAAMRASRCRSGRRCAPLPPPPPYSARAAALAADRSPATWRRAVVRARARRFRNRR